MCGIVTFFSNKNNAVIDEKYKPAFISLMARSIPRGTKGFGIFTDGYEGSITGQSYIHLSPFSALHMFDKDMVGMTQKIMSKMYGKVWISHVRAPSKHQTCVGGEDKIHPYAKGKFVGVHNGTVPFANKLIKVQGDFDTQMLLDAIYEAKTKEEILAIMKTKVTSAVVFVKGGKLHYARDTGRPLWKIICKDITILISELSFISGMEKDLGVIDFEMVMPEEVYIADLKVNCNPRKESQHILEAINIKDSDLDNGYSEFISALVKKYGDIYANAFYPESIEGDVLLRGDMYYTPFDGIVGLGLRSCEGGETVSDNRNSYFFTRNTSIVNGPNPLFKIKTIFR